MSQSAGRAVAFYVSGHGFGHAVRTSELIRRLWALEPELPVVVKTPAPEWLFGLLTGREVEVEHLECDVGVAQRDSLHVDTAATLHKVRALVESWDGMIESEAEACLRAGVGLIVSDIPAVACLTAKALGVPSIVLANFSWDWIYEGYAAREPGFKEVIPPMREAYGSTTLLLKLPMSPAMETFPRRKEIPLLVRTSDELRERLRERLGLKPEERAVLLSFGGIGFEGVRLDALSRLKRYRFVIFGDSADESFTNVTVLPHRCPNHHEWVRAADVVVTKPGYGVVAECLASATPMLHTSRGEFAEYPLLVEAIVKHLPNRFVAREEFVAGRWTHLLDELTEEERPAAPVVDCSGADKAARIILEQLG